MSALPGPQNVGTASGLLWLPDSRTVLLGGAPRGQPDHSATAFMVVDALNGKMLTEVPGLMKSAEELGLEMFAPTSPVADAATQIYLDAKPGQIVVQPVAGLHGLEVFETSTWKATVERLDASRGRPRFGGACSLAPDGIQVALAGSDQFGEGSVLVFDRRDGSLLYNLQAHPASTHVLAYSPDGGTLLSGMLATTYGKSFAIGAPVTAPDADEHKVVAWETRTYTRAGQLDAHIGSCYALAFHPDGSMFAMGSNDEIALFNGQDLSLAARLPVTGGWIATLSFSPDGSRLAAGGTDCTVFIFEP